MQTSSLLLALISLACFALAADHCCMPRGHAVTVRDSLLSLTNCTANGCSVSKMATYKYRHYPDLDGYRYRLDFEPIDPAQGPFPAGTTLGYVLDKETLLGIEYTYNKTHCDCRQTSKPSGIYHITCVGDEFTFVKDIVLGALADNKAQLYTIQNRNQTNLSINNFVAQTYETTKTVPLCALVHQEEDVKVMDQQGQLLSLFSRRIECSDFRGYPIDEDYVVPMHCPPRC